MVFFLFFFSLSRFCVHSFLASVIKKHFSSFSFSFSCIFCFIRPSSLWKTQYNNCCRQPGIYFFKGNSPLGALQFEFFLFVLSLLCHADTKIQQIKSTICWKVLCLHWIKLAENRHKRRKKHRRILLLLLLLQHKFFTKRVHVLQ